MIRSVASAVRVLIAGAAVAVLAACGAGAAPESQAGAGATGATGGLSIDYAALPQSKTPQGYHLLGRADAPILIQHYSDLL